MKRILCFCICLSDGGQLAFLRIFQTNCQHPASQHITTADTGTSDPLAPAVSDTLPKHGNYRPSVTA